ncbi:MAG: hypothetical protein GX539_09920 [Candidatus Cloacimonetes bacterium]|jgi:hypothetical protein|nr:hypothetical protein [Candidatus Cloacimonadota bacterium]
MKYVRMTSATVREALDLAREILTERLPLEVVASDAHSLTLSGADGTVKIHAHKHGVDTQLDIDTDQLRTSRLDNEVQYWLTMLPYQPGEVRGRGAPALPAGLSRQGGT